jgi:hypothetical protein
MNMRSVWLGVGVACLLSANVAPASADDERGGLRLTAGQTDFLRQEPILVTLRSEGDSPRELPASLGDEGPSPILRFEIEPAVKPRKGGKPLPAESRTGTSMTRKYDLLEWYQFPGSGTFSVRAVYERAGTQLTSGPVTITLRTPKKGEADFDAVARIHHIPWSNYETNAYCGDTFDVVKRWPDSALARYCHYWNGRYSQHQKDYAKAIASYEELLARYPDFALADDARRGLEECRKSLASR